MILLWSGVGVRSVLGAEPDNGAQPLMGKLRYIPDGDITTVKRKHTRDARNLQTEKRCYS